MQGPLIGERAPSRAGWFWGLMYCSGGPECEHSLLSVGWSVAWPSPQVHVISWGLGFPRGEKL